MAIIEQICAVNVDFNWGPKLQLVNKRAFLHHILRVEKSSNIAWGFDYNALAEEDGQIPRISFYAANDHDARTMSALITKGLVAAGCVIHENMENNKLTEATGSVASQEYWAWTDDGKLVPLGACESYDEASEKEPGNTHWIFSRQGLEEFRVELDRELHVLGAKAAIEQNRVADLQAWAVTVCERRGIRLVEAEEDEVKGRWDWIFEEQGMACESSFETQGAAALDAVETHFIVRDYEKEAYKAKQDKIFFPTYRDWVDLKADMELEKNTVSARPGM